MQNVMCSWKVTLLYIANHKCQVNGDLISWVEEAYQILSRKRLHDAANTSTCCHFPLQSLHILMPERLIGRRSPIANVIQRHVRRLIARPALVSLLRRSVALSTPQGTLHPFILVWALLIPELAPCWSVSVSLDPVAPSAAAARAEEPEEARGEGEEDAEPDGHVNAVAEGAVNVVFLQRIIEGACQGSVEDGGCKGESDKEDGADGGDDGSR